MPGETLSQGSVKTRSDIFKEGRRRLVEFKVKYKTVLVGKNTSKHEHEYAEVDRLCAKGYEVLVDPKGRDDSEACAVTESPVRVLMGKPWDEWNAMNSSQQQEHKRSIAADVAEGTALAEKHGLPTGEQPRVSLGEYGDGMVEE